MNTTAESIKAFAMGLPEGTTISAKELLHLGGRAAVDQALSRMTKRGELMRVNRGLFALPVATRFGTRAPSVEAVVASITKSTGETVSVSGASAANLLGLSTQNPTRQIYWTSGSSRSLTLGAQCIELQHVPNWKLRAPQSRAGHALRAMAWYGKADVAQVLHRIKPLLNEIERRELFALRRGAPTWLAKELSVLAVP